MKSDIKAFSSFIHWFHCFYVNWTYKEHSVLVNTIAPFQQAEVQNTFKEINRWSRRTALKYDQFNADTGGTRK